MSSDRVCPALRKVLIASVFGVGVFLIPNGAQSATNNSVTLQWDANQESDLAGYYAYHGTTSGNYGPSLNVGNTTTYQYDNLAFNKTHYFAVAAYDTSGNVSSPSLEVSKAIIGPDSTLSISISGSGTVSSNPGGVSCPSGSCSGTFPQGSQVTLNAVPSSGSTFSGWSGGGCSGTGSCVVTLSTSSVSVGATFAVIPPPARSLNVALAGGGSGTVSSNPGGVSCPSGSCSGTFPQGSQVTLNAVPSSGSTFSGWSGGGCSGTGSCVVTLSTSSVSVGATFAVIPPPARSLNVALAGGGSGTVSSNPGGVSCPSGSCSGTFPQGSQVTLNAVPSSGSTFSGWSGGGCSGTGSCVVTLSTSSVSVGATFAVIPPPARSLNVALAGGGSGTVSSNPGGVSCPSGSCSGTFPQGSQVTLNAVPSSGSTFSGWSGGGCSGTGSCVVTLSTSSVSVGATFAVIPPPARSLNVALAGGGSGTVSSNPGGVSCPSGSCSGTFPQGSQVTLNAVPSSGSTFSGWSGGGCSGTGSCVVTLSTSSVSVGATFAVIPPPARSLNVALAGGGSGTVSSNPGGVSCPSGSCSGTFPQGSQVTLNAVPSSGSTFSGWSGGGCSGTGSCVVTLSTSSVSVGATFAVIPPPARSLNVALAGGGSGTVSSNPGGVSCPSGSCSGTFPQGSQVTLNAVPSSGSTFSGWSGGGCSGTGSCVVTLSTSSVSVGATFAVIPPPARSLNVALAGGGSGTVSSNPGGVSCPSGSCSGTFPQGSQVTLNAVPSSGSTFSGWSGGGCSGTGSCVVTLSTSSVSVGATFAVIPPPARSLNVALAGGGSGTVSSNPGGVSCPSGSCSGTFPQGSQVTLNAVPSSGSTFSGWSGGGCSGTGSCVVTLSTSSVSVGATFAVIPPPARSLNVALAGGGSGTVSSNPGGVSCPSGSCSGTFPQGSQVTLNAVPSSGSTFSGWSGGGCSGTGSCVVTLSTSSVSVGATFAVIPPPASSSSVTQEEIKSQKKLARAEKKAEKKVPKKLARAEKLLAKIQKRLATIERMLVRYADKPNVVARLNKKKDKYSMVLAKIQEIHSIN